MKTRYWLYRRGKTYYLHDKQTGKQESLRTKVKAEAERIRQARNEAEAQPTLNLALARAYLSAHDPKMVTRRWQEVMDLMATKGKEVTQTRCAGEMRTKPFDRIRNKSLHETNAEDFLAVLEKGGSSTNAFLRRLHNLALGLGWLAWPILAPKSWPRPKTNKRRAITWEEHQRIITSTINAEWRNFYDLLWEVGASQSDGAFEKLDAISQQSIDELTPSNNSISNLPSFLTAWVPLDEAFISIKLVQFFLMFPYILIQALMNIGMHLTPILAALISLGSAIYIPLLVINIVLVIISFGNLDMFLVTGYSKVAANFIKPVFVAFTLSAIGSILTNFMLHIFSLLLRKFTFGTEHKALSYGLVSINATRSIMGADVVVPNIGWMNWIRLRLRHSAVWQDEKCLIQISQWIAKQLKL